ncbi:MAG: calcium-binding protein [Pseudomonadota bacterium]
MAFDGSTMSAATQASFVSGVYTDTFNLGNSDVDMVRIDLVAGQRYSFDIDNGTAGDFYLRIFNQSGVEVRANDDGLRATDDVVFSLSPFVQFTPDVSGPYFVAVSPYYLRGYDPATTLGRVTPENPLVPTDGRLTVTLEGASFWGSAGSINGITAESSSDLSDQLREADGSLRVELVGAIDSAADVDIIRIDLNKSDILVIDVNGSTDDGTIGTMIRVFDDSGVQIGVDDDSGFGEDPELIFVAPVLDDYYIGLSGEGNTVYSAIDGTGTVAAAGVGDFEVILHRNPTQIGSTLANFFTGGAADNYIVTLGGNDTASGNEGDDTIAGGDDQDSISGNNGLDMLYGEHGNDTLRGQNGNDVLSGGLGNDLLDGGAQDDVLSGGAGNDSMLGGGQNDTLSGDAGNDTVSAASGNDRLDGGIGNDSLLGGTGIDTQSGGDGDDSIFGQDGNDSLAGDSGNDLLNGGRNEDLLFGGSGDDVLLGAAGNDSLEGGDGFDTLTGSVGDDVFVFNSTTAGLDVITDFDLATGDVIDLRGVFGAGVVTAGNMAQFIQVSNAGIGSSFLAVDANGPTGGLTFAIIAQVDDMTPAQLFDVSNFLL